MFWRESDNAFVLTQNRHVYDRQHKYFIWSACLSIIGNTKIELTDGKKDSQLGCALNQNEMYWNGSKMKNRYFALHDPNRRCIFSLLQSLYRKLFEGHSCAAPSQMEHEGEMTYQHFAWKLRKFLYSRWINDLERSSNAQEIEIVLISFKATFVISHSELVPLTGSLLLT